MAEQHEKRADTVPAKPKAKPRGRPFAKGDARRGPGRAKGQPNHVTLEVKELCRGLIESPEYQASLKARIATGELAPAIESLLWQYSYGKPKETVDVNANVAYTWLS